MSKSNGQYDILVLGAGIAGGMTALALSQAGLKTLVVECSKHPRFAIGESTIPTTTVIMDQIAERWHIPELRGLTRYVKWAKNPPLCDFPKSHFWFGWHTENTPLDVSSELLFETLDPPCGPDTHIIRADVDGYLVSLFPKYGIDYLERTQLKNHTIDDKGVAHVDLESRDGQIDKVTCRFVVDATGHSAFFSKRLGLFEGENVSLKTNTRAIYGHFKQDAMPELDDAVGGPCPLFRMKRSAGTMHHCFKGGWIWVIPFDSGTVSVGIVLDRNIYPAVEGLGAREEFYSIIKKFPTVEMHLGKLEPTMPFVRKARLQIMSKGILGPGVILTPHASAFIDPLFSTGMMLTSAFVRDFVPLAQQAKKENDFNIERFRPIEKLFFRDVEQIDTVVAGVIESFRDKEVFKQFWRAWICSSIYQLLYSAIIRGPKIQMNVCGLYGSNKDNFRNDVQRMWQILIASKNEDQKVVAEKLRVIIDKHWGFADGHPYRQLMGAVGSRYPFKVVVKKTITRFAYHLVMSEWRTSFIGRSVYKWLHWLYFRPYWDEVLYHFKLIPKDDRRRKTFADQKLPWYDSALLK